MKILAVALFVVAMTALTTADDDVFMENPAPEDMVPEIPLNETTEPDGFPESTGAVRRKRWLVASGGLKWVRWPGYPPRGSVWNYNRGRRRLDYVCKYGCNSGFYNRNKGPFCNYPLGYKERRSYYFEILVNPNYQRLVWRSGSHGRIHHNSVKTCRWSDLYVGRDKHGLGKIHVSRKSFYRPEDGKERWSQHYEVLTWA